jgi:hypothetical protein
LNPVAAVEKPIWWWDRIYKEAQELVPGRGYWVHAVIADE